MAFCAPSAPVSQNPSQSPAMRCTREDLRTCMSPPPDPHALKTALSRHQRPSHRRSVLELLVTALPLALLWGGALIAVRHGWWWGLALTLPAAAFLVRLFMIQHDCGHAAFFRSPAANRWTGRIIGVLTHTPYDYWR